MLRIALVTQAYHPAVGGVTEHVDATARELRARGHDVTVVTSRFRDAAPEPGVARVGRNVSVAYNGAENNVTIGLSLARGLGAVLEKGRFDVVHVHCPLSPILPLLALQLAPCPTVGTFHSALVSDAHLRLFRPVLVPFYRRMDRVIAVSETARACVAALFPGPVEIVPNGVDRSRFFPGVPKLERFDDGTPNILFVGRFDTRKGLPELMQACAVIAREEHCFRVILVGDGTLRPAIERMAEG
ncbi:MAG: glycosyltransferase family 4 protein, partial [Candidatus Eiseniibacteriota bacterium]